MKKEGMEGEEERAVVGYRKGIEARGALRKWNYFGDLLSRLGPDSNNKGPMGGVGEEGSTGNVGMSILRKSSLPRRYSPGLERGTREMLNLELSSSSSSCWGKAVLSDCSSPGRRKSSAEWTDPISFLWYIRRSVSEWVSEWGAIRRGRNPETSNSD